MKAWWADILKCPVCGDAVADICDDRHDCFDHDISVRSGRVLDLSRDTYYWNHLTEEQMGSLLDEARTSGWQKALDEHFRPQVDEYTYAYATDERRADWYPLCHVPEEPLILDIGAGWGAVSLALARRGAYVIAADSNIETLEFIALKAEQEGLGDRLVAVRIDPLETVQLPIADESIDLVIMNGVLEWVGPASLEASPEALQRRVLIDVHRSIALSGQLYVGIESRYSFENLRGAMDHSGMSYTALLPRKLASWVTQRAGKGPYRTYTHGYGAWRKIFRETGFGSMRAYAAMPDYRFPHRTLPLDDAKSFRSTIDSVGVSRKHRYVLKTLSYLGLHRNAVGHYSMVADK